MNKLELRWNFGLLSALVVLGLSHCWMIFVNGAFWDDYWIWNVSPEELYGYLGPDDANEVFQYWYCKKIIDSFPLMWQVPVFRMLSMFFHGISLVCAWYLLRMITRDFRFTFLSSMLIAAFGMDKTAMLIVCSHFVIANALFMMGLVALVYDYYYDKRFLRYLTAVIWFGSLFVWRSAALLMPFAIVVLACAKTVFSFSRWESWIETVICVFRQYWMIILACVTFIPVYVYILAQSGAHSDYYSPQDGVFTLLPLTSVVSTVAAVVMYWATSLGALFMVGSIKLSLLVLAAMGGCYFFVRMVGAGSVINNRLLIVLSLAWLFLSMFPLLMIYAPGEMLNVMEYKSRLLHFAAFPLAIISVCLLQSIVPKLRYCLYTMLLIGSIDYTIGVSVEYAFAQTKVECLVEFLKVHPELKDKEIVVKDYAFSAVEHDTVIRGYAYTGMAHAAYGTDSHTLIHSFYYHYPSNANPEFEIRCFQNTYPIDIGVKARMVIFKYLNTDRYHQFLNEFYSFELEKLADEQI